MYVIVWRFRPQAGRELDFERAYGQDGPWTALFRRASGFIGTGLLRSTDESGAYLTIDRWESQTAYETFADQWAHEYTALDQELEALTSSETFIGSFEELTSMRDEP